MSKELDIYAFPSPNGQFTGMSLRDYFAAKAMQHFLTFDKSKLLDDEVARAAYVVADAMLEERNK